MTLNIAVLAPTPKASTETATTVKPGALRKARMAERKSRENCSKNTTIRHRGDSAGSASSAASEQPRRGAGLAAIIGALYTAPNGTNLASLSRFSCLRPAHHGPEDLRLPGPG